MALGESTRDLDVAHERMEAGGAIPVGRRGYYFVVRSPAPWGGFIDGAPPSSPAQ